MTSVTVALRFAPAILLLATRTASALPEGCPGLGAALVDHSCFHTTYGPFKSVRATAGAIPREGTADINAVHTDYRIGLAGDVSVVTYVPERSGAWTIFLGSHVPFRVFDEAGSEVERIFATAGNVGCEGLTEAHVFELDRAQPHRIVFGPTTATSVVAVVEFVEDFLVDHGRDLDGDGYGTRTNVVRSPCSPSPGYAPNTSDCDDDDPATNPGALELCDGVDQNCNALPDDEGLECRAGKGECAAVGALRCDQRNGEPARCTATPAPPSEETCNGRDDDCDGIIDGSDALCASSLQGPACVREGFAALCGCSLDQDCGSPTSGRICDERAHRCVDGCNGEPGRNGCPAGSSCVAMARADGVCMTKAGATGGTGGVAEPPPAGNSAGSNDAHGCGCRVVSSRRHGSLAGFAGILIGASLWVRRRRHATRVSLLARWCSALALALSLGACGGRVEDAETGGSAGDANAPPDGSGGQATCVPVLGVDTVAHACSHTDHGPYIPIAAVVGVTPDVSELHKTFSVRVVNGGASLAYVPKRMGQHVVLTNREVALTLIESGTAEPISGPSFDVQGCSSITRSRTVNLVAGQRYQLRIDEPEGSEFELFVEYPPAFGAKAWKRPCDP